MPRDYFQAQGALADYTPESFEREGFIHLTNGADEVIATGNRYYRSDPRPYVALRVDLTRVRAPVRYDALGTTYPHLHGPLNREAIVEAIPLDRLPDGAFLPFDER